MPRVICDLPNAAGEISGIKFHPLDDGGLISDEISTEQAARFASIPGYEIAADEAAPAPEPVKDPAPTRRKAKAAEPAAPTPEPGALDQGAPAETDEVF